MVTLSHAQRTESPDISPTLTHVGVYLGCEPSARRETLRAAIARHGGYCNWTVDHTGWVVTLHLPIEMTFSARTLEDALTSCLAWLVALERRATLSHR